MTIAYVFIKEDDITRTKADNGGWNENEAIKIFDSGEVFTGWYVVKLLDELNDVYKDYCKFDATSTTTNIAKAQAGTLLRVDTYCPFLADNIVVYDDVPTVTVDTQTIDVSGYTNMTITYELVSPTTTSVRVKGILTDSTVDVNQLETVLSVNSPKAVIDLGAFSGQTIKFNLSDIASSGDTVQIKIRGKW